MTQTVAILSPRMAELAALAVQSQLNELRKYRDNLPEYLTNTRDNANNDIWIYEAVLRQLRGK